MLKCSPLRIKSRDELLKMVCDLKREQLNLRFQKAYDQLQNPLRIKDVRRDIARLYTVLNAKKLGDVDA